MGDLAIVIVNYNTRELLRDCLKSIYASRGDLAFQVWVVDNASSDGSAAMVRQEFPQVHLIESPINGGYAYANNLGLRAAGFTDSQRCLDRPPSPPMSAPQPPDVDGLGGWRFALLLNPDTVLPPDALADMLAFMEARPDAGVAGPRLVLADGRLDLACRRSFPTPEVSAYRMIGLSKLFPRSRRFGRYNLTYLDEHETAEVDSVVGAFMLVRAEAIQQVGLLDERFFMYGEDLDWAKRIKDAGWKVYYNADVTVFHVKRAVSRYSARAQVEFYRAMRLFYDKHYAQDTPRWLGWLVLAGIALGEWATRLRVRLWPPEQALTSGETSS